MQPIRTSETNFTYKGPTPDISDLPCRVEGVNRDKVFSVWQPTEEEAKILASGKGAVRLGIYGAVSIPPVSLQVVEISNEPFYPKGHEYGSPRAG